MYQEIDLDKIDIHAEPPTEEPARQYYFMAKCRKWVEGFEQKNSRRPCFCTQTFGCQMNARDSEKLGGILTLAGFVEAESEQADLVIYNTCTVRENANNRVYGRLGYLHSLKKKHPHMRIALCGCMMQEPAVVEKLKQSYRFVNLVFGTHNLYQFAELLARSFETDKMVVAVWDQAEQIVEELPAERKFSFKSGVNVMFGCNNFCSYCIVPYVRGREKSREPKEILREIERLVSDGVVEIMLLGQNVNSYGKTFDPPVTFAQLLQEVEKIEGLRRIRFMTSHPKDLSDELIEVMARSKKICRHLHLPLQSGSSRILEKMNRRYDKETYLALVERIREAIPELALTTDMIVGFPGETEEDFLETMDVVKKVGFDSAFTFIYSRRSGTPAAEMEGQVPQEVVKERFDRLLTQVQQIAAQKAQRLVGSVQEVLVESVNEQDASLVTGKTEHNFTVHLPGTAELVGQLVDVRLDECRGFYYYGSIV
ncbi:MAG: tRNA (N6-isopentenyl adenosine(37)-C2)-methylthiotransferase MiaB [Eubacterium sp.]|nr:tRNA (N6-isopentenyl adenosine(37)-C2)-methylthiotransferase MiaB [Eubacterium sp.]